MTKKQKSKLLLSGSLLLCQILLAVTFIWAGFQKIVEPESLPFPWTKEHPTLVLLTGIVDLLGGIGLILPAALRFKSNLSFIAIIGLMLLMLSAIGFHMIRSETNAIGFNLVVLLVLIFMLWASTRKQATN